jgi:sortase A
VGVRRILVAGVLLVLLASAVAVTTRAEPAQSEPVAVDSLPAEDLPPVAPDAIDATTTTTAPATTTTTVLQPVDPPANAYAEEPHVVIGTIEIPKLGLAVPLNQGISLRSIDRGPSHWPGTALPGGVGNTVIAGHRVTHSKPFRHIDSLVAGDEIIFVVDGVRSVYHVTGSEVVTPDRTDIVNQTPDPMATLFACHPPGSAKYRYVVRAALVSTSPA